MHSAVQWYGSSTAVRHYLQHAVHPPSVQQHLLRTQVVDAERLHQLHVGLRGNRTGSSGTLHVDCHTWVAVYGAWHLLVTVRAHLQRTAPVAGAHGASVGVVYARSIEEGVARAQAGSLKAIEGRIWKSAAMRR